MNIQVIIISILFICAVFYVARFVFKSLSAKKGCSSGCGKCGVDFSNIDTKTERD